MCSSKREAAITSSPPTEFVMRDHSKTPRYPHQGSADALLWRRPAACSRCDWVKPEEGALSSADNGHQLALWQRDCKVKRRRRRNKKKKNMRTQSERQSKGFWECERNRWKKRDELKGFFCCFFCTRSSWPLLLNSCELQLGRGYYLPYVPCPDLNAFFSLVCVGGH